jgi:hypothetical protein
MEHHILSYGLLLFIGRAEHHQLLLAQMERKMCMDSFLWIKELIGMDLLAAKTFKV